MINNSDKVFSRILRESTITESVMYLAEDLELRLQEVCEDFWNENDQPGLTASLRQRIWNTACEGVSGSWFNE